MSVSATRSSSRPRLLLADDRIIRFPAVMGILNVTPDSFRDGGLYRDPEAALDHAIEMAEHGATIIDVGGESTRPGASEVPIDEELARVIPVIEMLSARLTVPISVDTRKAPVARAAVQVGAAIINDVSGLTFDPAMAAVAAESRVAVVLMHMRGTPETMSSMANYRDVVSEVRDYLEARVAAAVAAGISGDRIIVDPGLGFAKNPADNLALMRGLPAIAALGRPVLIGFSGKALELRLKANGERERIARTIAAEVAAVILGASILRVHDPGPTAMALRVAASLALNA
ncbi:MAG: dihydropteroate synthase [Candidatus Binataceae bacterium]|nr:dihydropteroate synthase [Candidatus Binataceae bacterium]